jgi:branched-chain amino acid transport system substrate-binding protein
MKTNMWKLLTVMVVLTMLVTGLAACGATPEPQVVKETVVVTEKETVVVTEKEQVEVTKVVKEEVEKVVTATPAPEAPTPVPEPVTLYVGGAMALTGAYAEDTAAVLAAYEDYVKYVNDTKMLAPWREEKFPENVTLEVLWRDDELNVEKALSIYEELKGKGMLVYRIGGSPQALALKDLLNEDRMGAPSMATGPYLLSPPQTIFTLYPIYTDSLAAVAEWFMENWKEDRAPRVAYLTADNAMGRSIEIPEFEAYLVGLGYEFVGGQYVPLVPTAPPTTQLLWLKENNVDLTLGVMINPGSQPTIKEAVRLGMGPHLDYKITFACATPSHLQVFLPAMGDLAEGFVVGGGYPSWDDPAPGMAFALELQDTYRPNDKVTHIMYPHGMVEAMVQVEALRLAMQEVPAGELRPVDVLEYGFYQIKDLDTGGVTSTPLTYGPGDVEGMSEVRVQQIQDGKIVEVGTWPLRHIYKHE